MSDGWESLAFEWDHLQGEHGDAYRRHVIHPAVDTAISGMSAGRALDVGSGNGALARFLAARGWSVVGVEASPTLVRLAQEYEATAAPSGLIDYECADARTFTAAAGTFDLVVTLFSHQDIGSIDAVYNLAATALAPGGRVIIVGEDLDTLLTAGSHELSSRSWVDQEGLERRQLVTWMTVESAPTVVTTISAASEYSAAAARSGFTTLHGPAVMEPNAAAPAAYAARPRFLIHVTQREARDG